VRLISHPPASLPPSAAGRLSVEGALDLAPGLPPLSLAFFLASVVWEDAAGRPEPPPAAAGDDAAGAAGDGDGGAGAA
jgi:hypothetical protein